MGAAIICAFVLALLVFVFNSHKSGKSANRGVNQNQQMINYSEIDIEETELDRQLRKELDDIRARNRKWECQFGYLMEHQNNGMMFEKNGCLEKAADSYNKAISYGRRADLMRINNYFHSYRRLVIVYRKLKDYAHEIDTIKLALSEELAAKDKEWLTDRLNKAEKLLNKSTSPCTPDSHE